MTNTRPSELQFDTKTARLVMNGKPVNLEYLTEETLKNYDSYSQILAAATRMNAEAFYVIKEGANLGHRWAFEEMSPLAAPSYLDTSNETVPTLEEDVRVVAYKILG
jgi:hypothetical protein